MVWRVRDPLINESHRGLSGDFTSGVRISRDPEPRIYLAFSVIEIRDFFSPLPSLIRGVFMISEIAFGLDGDLGPFGLSFDGDVGLFGP